MVTRIDVPLQSGDVSVDWMWLLLDVSDVTVVIVIIAICDMPRQKFSLCERVYIHNTYMKSRKSFSETRRKFRVKFPGRPVPNSSTIRTQAKRFKETGSVKNRNVNRRRHVLTEETLDEIGEINWTEITVSVWEQRQYVDPLVGKSASQSRERQSSIAASSSSVPILNWIKLNLWGNKGRDSLCLMTRELLGLGHTNCNETWYDEQLRGFGKAYLTNVKIVLISALFLRNYL